MESLGNSQTSLEANIFSSTMSASKLSLETFKSRLEMVLTSFSGPQRWAKNYGRKEKAVLPFDFGEIPNLSHF